ncbi:hypothetical protein [Runella slithyformis]|uniref:Small multi-drug export protein n=1 Tax=Runella slithyformis (strain ATCC 29530 / DSM 19594 / LMG 11500 / NCIMB 11436 / LSU 4) TaxID=761193 RepID=A0A7U4E771_RUNSL|nr:hypothetical protein [Runella slithyformis]AEI50079.1 hypothetical protein Runsl_3721 [Runella slithyformis DSM 19594]
MPWAKYISVVLASMVKFVAGPLAGVALSLSWWETALCTVVGMMLSVVIFVFLGSAIQQLIGRYRKKKPKLFSKRSRLAVRVWKRSGMTGIAILTPLLFTPIGGTLIAVSFKVPKHTIIAQMLLWGIIWGVIMSFGLFQFRSLV